MDIININTPKSIKLISMKNIKKGVLVELPYLFFKFVLASKQVVGFPHLGHHRHRGLQ